MMHRFLAECSQWRQPHQCLTACLGECTRRFNGRPRVHQLCLNSCHGLAAQMSTDRALRNRGHRVEVEIKLPGGNRLDRSVELRSGGRVHHEEKHLDLPHYLRPDGQLNEPMIRRRLQTIISQVNRYQQALRRSSPAPTAALPRVRLVVRVPATTARAQAAALQRFLLAELTPLGIAVTVIMPGSRASHAFEI
jgi:hypothetical protein